MIEFKDIEIKYGDFVAMQGLNLTVKEGEFFSFLGPSGSGKTTVLRALTGLSRPSSGQILVAGDDITYQTIEKRQIGIVFQSYALFPTMNVYENIAYGLKVRKMPKAEIEKTVQEIITKIDLAPEQLKKKVSELSGGQQQRVAIARALVTKPKILCLDEPLSNLDAKLRQKLRSELKALQRDFGITTIYVTHDQEEALTLSDRIAVFDNGNLQQVGTPTEIYQEPKTEFVANFIGEVNKLDAAKVQTLVQDAVTLDLSRPVYVMINDISHQEQAKAIAIPGVITEVEYFGFYVKYALETANGVTLRFLTFLDMNKAVPLSRGDHTTVYIHPNRLKQYSV